MVRRRKKNPRKRKCKHGALKTPYRDAKGRMHYCRARPR